MIKVRLFTKKDSELVSKLILSVFMEFNLKGVTTEGIEFFNKNHQPDKIRRDWAMTYRIVEERKKLKLVDPFSYSLVGICNEKIICVGRIKYDEWITHCFVDKEYQKRGIGRSLIERMERWITKNPKINLIRLNSSPFAVGFYEHLGYKRVDKTKEYHGIPINQMEKVIR